MFKSGVIVLVLLASRSLCAAQSLSDDDLSSFEMHGKIGDFRVGLNFTVRDKTNLVAAHYFYASQLENIVLSGEVQGETVLFKGEDGSTFQLRFVGNGSNGSDLLTFYTSVGLKGAWTLGTRTLPVTLHMEYGTVNPGQRLYDQVTPKADAAFELLVQAARRAILDHDVVRASALIHFPLTVNLAHRSIKVKNLDQLKTNWSVAFPQTLIAKLREDIPHEMFVHEGEAMLGQGELWFDEFGLTVVNEE